MAQQPIDYDALAQQFGGARATGPAPPTGPDDESPPDGQPWTARYPTTAAVAAKSLEAFPAIGALAGAVAGGGSTGLGAVPAMALGAGIGRGVQDLIAEGLGLEPVTSPGGKAGRIALDTAETAVVASVLPGLWEAVKTPGKTLREVLDVLPARLRPKLPAHLATKPARLLVRPAWQTWGPYLDEAAAPTGPLAVPPPSAPLPVPTSPLATPQIVPSSLPVPTTPLATPAVQPATTATMTTLQRLKPKLTAAEMAEGLKWLKAGLTPEQVLERLQAMRALSAGSKAIRTMPTGREVTKAVAHRNATGQW